MSRTFKVSDGDLDINRDTGRLQIIEGEVKLSQDLAEALMSDYDPDRDFGSGLNDLTPTGGLAGKAHVSQLVAEAVARLQSKQRADQLTVGEALESVSALRVAFDPDDSTKAYFYLAVKNDTGDTTETVMVVTVPTSLNQQIYPAAAVDQLNKQNLEGLQ